MRQLLAVLSLVALSAISAQAQQAYSLFGSQTPATLVDGKSRPVTVGLKFYANVPGTISSVRFYRGHANNTGYTVGLYTSGGSLLGQVKTASDLQHFSAGWETASFGSPIALSPNTIYVAAYHSSNGGYAVTDMGLENHDVVNGPVTAPDTSHIAGGNGVYSDGSGLRFPTHTYHGSNYFVDVVFTPSAPPAPTLSLIVTPSSPSIPSNTPIGAIVATVSAAWSDQRIFTGTYGFMAPYNDDSGVFALSGSSGSSVSLLVNAPLTGHVGIVQNVTVAAVQ